MHNVYTTYMTIHCMISTINVHYIFYVTYIALLKKNCQLTTW